MLLPLQVLLPLHGVGSRKDLPLPLELVVLAAAVVLVATFVVLRRAWRTTRWDAAAGRPLPRLTRFVDHPVTRWTLRLVVLALWLLVGVAAFAGRDVVSNPVFGFTYVWVWVGLVPVSLLAGRVWAATNPVRTVLSAWRRGDAVRFDRWGVWPAVAACASFAWLELVQPDRATLPVLQVWIVAWLVWVLGGALLLGTRWIAAADPFEAYATSVATLSPWQRIDGVLHLVNPLRHVVTAAPPRGLSALVCVLLGSTAFDSFSNSSAWIKHVQGSSMPAPVWGTLGLVALIAVVGVTFGLAVAWMRLHGTQRSLLSVADSLAPSVIPIVAGYAVAHYYSLLILEGQRTAIQLSDPLGKGWNLFGTAELGVNARIYDHPSLMAWIQVLAIVGGHVLGIVTAHELSLRKLPAARAMSGQIGLLAVMVFYTCSGLLLLFNV